MWRRAAATGCCLVSVAVVLLFPVFGRVKDGPPDQLASRLHRLWVATKLYVDDLGAYPKLQSPIDLKRALFPTYITDEASFRNPDAPGLIDPNPRLSGMKLVTARKLDPSTVLFYATTDRPGKVVTAALLDGRAKRYFHREWETAKHLSRIP